jgi:hypothetical protein
MIRNCRCGQRNGKIATMDFQDAQTPTEFGDRAFSINRFQGPSSRKISGRQFGHFPGASMM